MSNHVVKIKNYLIQICPTLVLSHFLISCEQSLKLDTLPVAHLRFDNLNNHQRSHNQSTEAIPMSPCSSPSGLHLNNESFMWYVTNISCNKCKAKFCNRRDASIQCNLNLSLNCSTLEDVITSNLPTAHDYANNVSQSLLLSDKTNQIHYDTCIDGIIIVLEPNVPLFDVPGRQSIFVEN